MKFKLTSIFWKRNWIPGNILEKTNTLKLLVFVQRQKLIIWFVIQKKATTYLLPQQPAVSRTVFEVFLLSVNPFVGDVETCCCSICWRQSFAWGRLYCIRKKKKKRKLVACIRFDIRQVSGINRINTAVPPNRFFRLLQASTTFALIGKVALTSSLRFHYSNGWDTYKRLPIEFHSLKPPGICMETDARTQPVMDPWVCFGINTVNPLFPLSSGWSPHKYHKPLPLDTHLFRWSIYFHISLSTMVQINFFVAFILAAATIVPVVALPVPGAAQSKPKPVPEWVYV